MLADCGPAVRFNSSCQRLAGCTVAASRETPSEGEGDEAGQVAQRRRRGDGCGLRGLYCLS